MAFVRWDPFKDLLFLQERVSQIFDEALLRYRSGTSNSTWSPPVDVYETEDSIVFKAELPGVDIESVDVEIQENTLTLRGERRFDKNLNEENYHMMERSYGTFHRVFNLPGIIDKNGVTANLKDGVLKITVPKVRESVANPIKIKIE